MVGVWLGAGGTVSHFIPLNPVRSRFFLMLDPLSRFQSDRSVGEMGDGAAVGRGSARRRFGYPLAAIAS